MKFIKLYEMFNKKEKPLSNEEKYVLMMKAIDQMFQVTRVKLERGQSYNAKIILNDIEKDYYKVVDTLEKRTPEKVAEFKIYVIQKLDQLILLCQSDHIHDIFLEKELKAFKNKVK